MIGTATRIRNNGIGGLPRRRIVARKYPALMDLEAQATYIGDR